MACQASRLYEIVKILSGMLKYRRGRYTVQTNIDAPHRDMEKELYNIKCITTCTMYTTEKQQKCPNNNSIRYNKQWCLQLYVTRLKKNDYYFYNTISKTYHDYYDYDGLERLF